MCYPVEVVWWCLALSVAMWSSPWVSRPSPPPSPPHCQSSPSQRMLLAAHLQCTVTVKIGHGYVVVTCTVFSLAYIHVSHVGSASHQYRIPFDVGNGDSPKALLQLQAPPTPCPSIMPWILLGDNTVTVALKAHTSCMEYIYLSGWRGDRSDLHPFQDPQASLWGVYCEFQCTCILCNMC